MRPRVLAIEPPPEQLVDSPVRLALRFDRAMDRSRGRVRLVWGRISAHFVNAARPSWRWSLRDPALAWSEDGRELGLRLPEGLLGGFRVRVEWSDLADPLGERPDPCEPDGTISYVLAVRREGPLPPLAVSSEPSSGEALRPDAVIELYAEAPVGTLEVERWRLEVGGVRQPFVLRSNRNPPDWIYLHPRRPLPLGRATLRVPANALRGTADQPMAEPLLLSWPVRGEAVPARPHPQWSEPPPGFDGIPRTNPRFALRFEDRPVLLPVEGLASNLTLQDDAGRVLAASPAVFHDPTPGHYRSVVLEFEATLPPRAEVRLVWTALQADGAPGALRFRTGSRAIAPLGNAASIFATQEGSFLQAHASVTGAVSRVRTHGEGWSQDLQPTGSRAFTPAAGEVQETYVTPLDAPPLPSRPTPGLRRFSLELTDAEGSRDLPGVAFDLGPAAIAGLEARWAGDLELRWRVQAPGDAVHACVLAGSGQPLWSGLFSTAATGAVVPRRWLGTTDGLCVQLWLVRARPEDDLWDYFVLESAVPPGGRLP